jgi:hypothetical protein
VDRCANLKHRSRITYGLSEGRMDFWRPVVKKRRRKRARDHRNRPHLYMLHGAAHQLSKSIAVGFKTQPNPPLHILHQTDTATAPTSCRETGTAMPDRLLSLFLSPTSRPDLCELRESTSGLASAQHENGHGGLHQAGGLPNVPQTGAAPPPPASLLCPRARGFPDPVPSWHYFESRSVRCHQLDLD